MAPRGGMPRTLSHVLLFGLAPPRVVLLVFLSKEIVPRLGWQVLQGCITRLWAFFCRTLHLAAHYADVCTKIVVT